MKASIAGIVSLAIGVFIFAVITPSALEIFYDVSVSTWGTTLQTMWYIVPVMLVISGLLAVVYEIKGSRGTFTPWVAIRRIKEMFKDRKGGVSVATIIGAALGLIVFVALMPTAINQMLTGFNTTDTTPFGAASTAVPFITVVVLLGSLIPTFAILAYVIDTVYTAVRR